MKLIGLHLHNSLVPNPPQRYDSKALFEQGCAPPGDGHGCLQSRRAGSRGTVINHSVPRRTHSRCSCCTHRVSKRCGQHAAPAGGQHAASRPGTVATVGLVLSVVNECVHTMSLAMRWVENEMSMKLVVWGMKTWPLGMKYHAQGTKYLCLVWNEGTAWNKKKFHKVWNFCIGVWKKFWRYEKKIEGMKKNLEYEIVF